jgi:hypothetical protein
VVDESVVLVMLLLLFHGQLFLLPPLGPSILEPNLYATQEHDN